MTEFHDPQLADHLEGLLDQAEAARLEAALASDPALAARHQALAELLAEPVELPELPLPADLVEMTLDRLQALDPDDLLAEPVALPELEVPAGLEDLVLARLEDEGLVAAPELTDAVPAGLYDATLARLEGEGLVQPERPAGRVLRFPAQLTPLLAVAALLLAVAALLFAGLGDRGGDAPGLAELRAQLQDAERAREASEDRSAQDVSRLQRELAAAQASTGEVRETVDQAAGRAAQLERALAQERDQRQALEDRLSAAVAAAQTLEQQLAGIDRRLAAPAGADPAELASLRAALEQRQAALDELHAAHTHALERLTGLEHAVAQSRDVSAAAMQVADVQGVDLWDFLSGAWLPLGAGEALPAGAVLRSHGRGSVQVADVGFPYDLRAGLYVVTASGRLEPLPDPSKARATSDDRPPSLGEGVRELIARLANGSLTEQSRAQTTLTALYRRLGDPSPDMVAFAQGGGVPTAAVDGPPSTPEDWERWWERVRDTVR